MIYQLRTYTLEPKFKELFFERFKEHASRIMASCDFNIEHVWWSEYENKLEFHYLLQWESKTVRDKSWDKLMTNQEWQEIKRRTDPENTMILDKADRILTVAK